MRLRTFTYGEIARRGATSRSKVAAAINTFALYVRAYINAMCFHIDVDSSLNASSLRLDTEIPRRLARPFIIKRSIDETSRPSSVIDRSRGRDHVAARRISERHYGAARRERGPPSILVTFLPYDDGFVGTSPVVFSDHRSARPELSPLTEPLAASRARDTGPFPRSAVRFVRAGEQNRGLEQRRGRGWGLGVGGGRG